MSKKLLLQLSKIILKLKAAVNMRIVQAGTAKAKELLHLYAMNGVFNWAPEVKGWIKDPKVIFYLGMAELSVVDKRCRASGNEAF